MAEHAEQRLAELQRRERLEARGRAAVFIYLVGGATAGWAALVFDVLRSFGLVVL